MNGLFQQAGRLRDTSVVPTLLKLLETPDSDIRPEIASALGNLGDTRAVPALLKLTEETSDLTEASDLENELIRSEAEDIRSAAYDALYHMGEL